MDTTVYSETNCVNRLCTINGCALSKTDRVRICSDGVLTDGSSLEKLGALSKCKKKKYLNYYTFGEWNPK